MDDNTKIGYGDSVLYQMCEGEHIRHNSLDTVAGKMWLIGRSYAASPERRQGKKVKKIDNIDIEKKLQSRTDADFFDKVADLILKSGDNKELDEKIADLCEAQYSYSDFDSDMDVLSKTVELIKLFNEMVMEASDKYNKSRYEKVGHTLKEGERVAQNNISFASKYLHFHLPNIVFIMDNISLKNGKEKYSEIKNKEVSDKLKEKREGRYKEYTEHALRCYCIAKKLKEEKKGYSPRAIDNVLMSRNNQ